MATSLNSSDVETWQDAFSHPIPQVRQLERQLRADLSTKKETLRALVGESYRGLLHTAEQIVSMDNDAHSVELFLLDAVRNCNSRVLDRKVRSTELLHQQFDDGGQDRIIATSHVLLVQVCARILCRLVRVGTGSICLLCAKVLVIFRSLLRSFPSAFNPPLLQEHRALLPRLRTLLLQQVDSCLAAPHTVNTELIAALGAFVLIRSSSLSEALRQLLHVRSTAISGFLIDPGTGTGTGTSIAARLMAAIKLLNRTISDVFYVFPAELRDILAEIRSGSLLLDKDMSVVQSLDLDMAIRWLPDDVRGFIPWVRHDDLEHSRVKELLSSWTVHEIEGLKDALKNYLESIGDLVMVTSLRQEVSLEWKSSLRQRRQLSEDSNDFRELFMTRVGTIINSEVARLGTITSDILNLLGDHILDSADVGLFSTSFNALDSSYAGPHILASTLVRLTGRDSMFTTFLDSYTSWITRISSIIEVIRGSRFSSKAPMPDELENDETLVTEYLEDSQRAERSLLTALDTTYRSCEARFGVFIAELEGSMPSDSNSTVSLAKMVLLLRIIRHVRSSSLMNGTESLYSLTWFGASSIRGLHVILARRVCGVAIAEFREHLSEGNWPTRQIVASKLWQGAPPLPTLPSMAVLRLLYTLVASMKHVGEDLWTPSALGTLRDTVCDAIWTALSNHLRACSFAEQLPEGPPETDISSVVVDVPSSKSDPPRNISKDWGVQILFDMLYLDEALHRRGRRRGASNPLALAAKVDSLWNAHLTLEESQRVRIESNAHEYWIRTAILFAILNN